MKDPFEQMKEDSDRDYSIMLGEMRNPEVTKGRTVWYRASYAFGFTQTEEIFGTSHEFSAWWHRRET
jgi:hypothetical protein